MGSLNESLYKCYFCKENVDRYNIEEHFKTIHKFKSLDHACEFCDEVFDTQNDLIKHAGVHSEKSESKLNSFEEGKSKFLPFMTSFTSEDDAFRLLDWINENLEDLRLFVKEDLKTWNDLENQDDENEALIEDQNYSKTNHNVSEKLELEETEVDEKTLNDFHEKRTFDYSDQGKWLVKQSTSNLPGPS